jgi:nicotinate phosphoribosyltransferase
LRHDSGDPIKFIETAKKAFLAIGSDPSTKVLVFSDGLDVERCLELKRRTDETNMLSSFGIGTFLTNDFKHVEHPILQATTPGEGDIQSTLEKSKPLNMVIKLSSIVRTLISVLSPGRGNRA